MNHFAGEQIHDLANRLIVEAGARNYEDDFLPDGIQDPYRAVDEADAIMWIHQAPENFSESMADYNHLYADTVMERAVRTGKLLLFYRLESVVDQPVPSILSKVSKRTFIKSIAEFGGIFRRDLNDLMKGRIPLPTSFRLMIFLCHSKQDKKTVRQLYEKLVSVGCLPWFDEESLVGGEDWKLAITKAVKQSDVVLVLLSRQSVSRPGFAQKEIRLALDVAEEKPEGTIFVVPVKLEECEVPTRLTGWHWINLFEEDGFDKLLKALNRRGAELGKTIVWPTTMEIESRGKTSMIIAPRQADAAKLERVSKPPVVPDATGVAEEKNRPGIERCSCGGWMDHDGSDLRTLVCRTCGKFEQWSD